MADKQITGTACRARPRPCAVRRRDDRPRTGTGDHRHHPSTSDSERAQLDARLAQAPLEAPSVGRIHTLVTTIAADVAPETFQDRVKAAHAGRWVSITPSPEDGTAPPHRAPADSAGPRLLRLGPSGKGLWCSPEPLTRTRGQIMADTLVERVTGLTCAADIAARPRLADPRRDPRLRTRPRRAARGW